MTVKHDKSPEREETSAIIFGKKLTGKKAIAAGTIIGILFGLAIVGILAFIIL